MKYLLAIGLALAMAHAIPATEEPRVEDLIRQLDDPRFDVRQYADESLRLAGLKIVPTLQAELQKNPPLEVARRLKSLIDHYVRPDWHQRVEEAAAEAQRTGKPILVVSLPPSSDNPDQWAPPEVASKELAHFLKQHYVVVWHISQGMWVGGPNGGHFDKACRSFCCAADGKVLQVHAGIPALDLLAENGKPRTLASQAAPVAEDAIADRVTPNGGLAINLGVNAGQLKEVQVQILRQGRYGRGLGQINPIGMKIQEVLGYGLELNYLR